MLNTLRRTGLVISLAGFAISVNTLPALVTWFSLRFGVPIASFGVIFLLQFASYTLCSMTVGRMHASRRLPLLGIVIGSMFLSAMCLFWIGSIPSFLLLIGMMIVIGGTGGLVESIGTTLITTTNGSNRMLYSSQFFYALGAFFAPMAVGFLLYIELPVPMIGRLIGLFSLGIGLVVALCVYQPWRSKQETTSAPLHQSKEPAVSAPRAKVFPEARKIAFPFLFLTMVFYVVLESSVGNWFAVYVHDALRLSSSQASFSLSMFWVGLGVSRFWYMIFVIRNHPRTLFVHMGIVVLSVLLLFFTPAGSGTLLIYGAVILLGIACGPIWPLLIEYCSHTFAQAHLIMYLVGAGSIGALLGPIVTSSLFSLIGVDRMIILYSGYAIIMIVAAVTTVTLIGRYRTSRTDHAV